MSIRNQLKTLVANFQNELINNERAADVEPQQADVERKQRWKETNKERKAEIVKANANGNVVNSTKIGDEESVEYMLHQQFLMKQNEYFYVEERMETRKSIFKNGKLTQDFEVIPALKDTEEQPKIERYRPNDDRLSFQYNRMRAVQYAEQWWNTFNPKYIKFAENDCTNFISQCLHEGGAPLYGMPNRSRGWWYKDNQCSYSWSVANSLRWYLSSAERGLRAQEVSSAQHLVPGDIICYDFDGDGRWQHNTIVVAKDQNNMPLVNAHTTNSRMRYWEYKDSTAWTPKVKYKFFHILDDN